jgi:transcriptional regulator with XRE-family HTH domain
MNREGTKDRFNAGSFRLFLQGELLSRCRKNESYSLRAFARALGCDAGTLSKVLSGKRAIGKITITRFGARLGLGPEEITTLEIPTGIPLIYSFLKDHSFFKQTK